MHFEQLQQDYLNKSKEVEEQRILMDEKIGKKYALIAKKEAQIERLQAQAKKLTEDKYNKIPHISWIDAFVEPIAQHFAEEFNMGYEIYGPFGMRAQTSIYWKKPEDKDVMGKPMYSLVLIPLNLKEAELGYETGFEKDGETPATYHSCDPNGFRHEVKPLPTSMEEIRACIHFYEGSEEE